MFTFLFTMLLIVALITPAYLYGLKLENDKIKKNLFLFFMIIVSALFFSYVSDKILSIEIPFIGKSISGMVINYFKKMPQLIEIFEFFPALEEIILYYLFIIIKILLLGIFIFISYIVIYIIRIVDYKNNKDEYDKREKNYVGGIICAVEALLVISITIAPVNYLFSTYEKVNNLVIDNYDENICDFLDLEDRTVCDSLDRVGKNSVLQNISKNVLNKFLINLVTEGDSNFTKDINDVFIKDLLADLYESNAIVIITDPNFSLYDLKKHNIDLGKITIAKKPINTQSKLTINIGTLTYNKLMTNFYEAAIEDFPKLKKEKLYLNKKTFARELAALVDLMQFGVDYDLLSLAKKFQGPAVLSIFTVIDLLLTSDSFSFKILNNAVKKLENLSIIKEMNKHVSYSGFEVLIGLYSKTVVTVTYVASLLMKALDNWIIEMRQLQLYTIVREGLLKLINDIEFE